MEEKWDSSGNVMQGDLRLTHRNSPFLVLAVGDRTSEIFMAGEVMTVTTAGIANVSWLISRADRPRED